MALIKAAWKRTVRIREYESETLELAVERGWDEVNDGDAVKASVELDRELARAGDALVVERLVARVELRPETAAAVKRRDARAGSSPVEPDEFV